MVGASGGCGCALTHGGGKACERASDDSRSTRIACEMRGTRWALCRRGQGWGGKTCLMTAATRDVSCWFGMRKRVTMKGKKPQRLRRVCRPPARSSKRRAIQQDWKISFNFISFLTSLYTFRPAGKFSEHKLPPLIPFFSILPAYFILYLCTSWAGYKRSWRLPSQYFHDAGGVLIHLFQLQKFAV